MTSLQEPPTLGKTMYLRSDRTIAEMRRDAQALKLALRDQGKPAIHGHCIEAVARANGYRTWAAALFLAPDGKNAGALAQSPQPKRAGRSRKVEQFTDA